MGSIYYLQNQNKTKTVIPTICEHATKLYYNDIRWHKHTGFEQKNSVPRNISSWNRWGDKVCRDAAKLLNIKKMEHSSKTGVI
jgi:hypothetical protein